MEVKNTEIFSSSSQFLLRNWVSCMIRTFGFSACGGNVVLPFALGIGWTICLTRVCFGFTIVGIGF